MDKESILLQFNEAWGARDVDSILSFFTEEAEYINIPMDPPNRGKPAIRAFVEGFVASLESIEFLVHHQVVQGDIVMNERTDIIVMNGKRIDLRVMGIFEFSGDKIAKWRDYFDMAPFTAP